MWASVRFVNTSTAPPMFTATVPPMPPLMPPVAKLSWFIAVTATPLNDALIVGETSVWPVSASNLVAGSFEAIFHTTLFVVGSGSLAAAMSTWAV